MGEWGGGGVVPLRAADGFLSSPSESESQMDLSGFFALGAAGFLGFAAPSDGFFAAADEREGGSQGRGPRGRAHVTLPPAGRTFLGW